MSAVPPPVPAVPARLQARGAGLPARATPALATPARATPVLATLGMAVAASLVLPVAPASAHDRLERVDPASGARVGRAPGQVQLVFDQAVGRRFSTVVVTGPDGAAWAVGPAQVLDGTVTQPLRPSGPAGRYTVAYRIVSADGHPVTGTSTFTVAGSPAAAAAPAGGVPSGTPAQQPRSGADAAQSRGAHGHGLAGPGQGLLAVGLLGAGSWAALRRRPSAGAARTGGRP